MAIELELCLQKDKVAINYWRGEVGVSQGLTLGTYLGGEGRGGEVRGCCFF